MGLAEQKIKLRELINQLITLGEDSGELSLWPDLFDILNDSERQNIIANLEAELKQLKNLAQGR